MSDWKHTCLDCGARIISDAAARAHLIECPSKMRVVDDRTGPVHFTVDFGPFVLSTIRRSDLLKSAEAHGTADEPPEAP